MANPIFDITPLTLLDFPQKIACIIWFAGCNMRCPYCYNVAIVEGKGAKSDAIASTFLHKRAGKLDGVVFSGGECTLHPKALIKLAEQAKSLNYAVKVDTNGSNPDLIKQLLKAELLDYVALDFKGSRKQMNVLTRLKSAFSSFEKTFKLLQDSTIDFELRTTVHQALLAKQDLLEMDRFLLQNSYKKTWFWQEFVDAPNTIGKLGPSSKNYGKELISNELSYFHSNIVVRG